MAVTRTGVGPGGPADGAVPGGADPEGADPEDAEAGHGGPDGPGALRAAEDLRHRAPELAVLFAERALEHAPDAAAVLRAGHLLGAVLNDCGRAPEAARRLVPLVADAGPRCEDAELHPVRVEVARSCLAVGAPITALAALRPVLDADDVPAALRAGALVRAASALGRLGRADAVPVALAGADLVQRDDPGLAPDDARALRAEARVVAAADARRRGSPREAEQLARGGLGLLTGLADAERGSGRLGAALLLELVQSLLDRGAAPAAVRAAESALERPVRAATCDALGWVRVALARRVHLAEGDTGAALLLLGDAASAAGRHGLDGVRAPALTALSHVHEARGDLAAALCDLREAHAAERRWATAVADARTALVELFGPERARDEVADRVAETVLARAVPGRPDAVLDRESYRQHVDLVLAGADQPVAHVVVRTGDRSGAGADAAGLAAAAGRLRATAPRGAVLGRLGPAAVAALLPGSDRDAAQRWADAAVGAGAAVRVGVAQHRAGDTSDQLLAAADRAARPAAAAVAGGSPPEPAPTVPTPTGSPPEPAPTGAPAEPPPDERGDGPPEPAPGDAAADTSPEARADEPVADAGPPAGGDVSPVGHPVPGATGEPGSAPHGAPAADASTATPERGLRVVAPWRDEEFGRGPHGAGWSDDPDPLAADGAAADPLGGAPSGAAPAMSLLPLADRRSAPDGNDGSEESGPAGPTGTGAPSDDLVPDDPDGRAGGWLPTRADGTGEVPALAALPGPAAPDHVVTDPSAPDDTVGEEPGPRPARPELVLAPPPTSGPDPVEAPVPRAARRGEHRTPVTALLPQDALARPRAGRRRAEQDRADRADEPDHPEPDRAEQDRADRADEPDHPEPDHPEPDRAEQDRADRADEPDHPEPDHPEPDRADPDPESDRREPATGGAPARTAADPGPPPAPSPRKLHGPPGRTRRDQGDGGLGDLLAEALAAFEEGRRPPVGPRAAGPATSARVPGDRPSGADRDGEPGRPAGGDRGDPPVWLPDAGGPDGRRSSAGE